MFYYIHFLKYNPAAIIFDTSRILNFGQCPVYLICSLPFFLVAQSTISLKFLILKLPYHKHVKELICQIISPILHFLFCGLKQSDFYFYHLFIFLQ